MKEGVLAWEDLASCLTSPKGAGQPEAGPGRSEGCAKRTKRTKRAKGDGETGSGNAAEGKVAKGRADGAGTGGEGPKEQDRKRVAYRNWSVTDVRESDARRHGGQGEARQAQAAL